MEAVEPVQDLPSVKDSPSVETLEAQMEDTKKEIQVYIAKIQEFIDKLCKRIGDVTEQDVPQANIPVTGDQTEIIIQLKQENDKLRGIINANKDGLTEIKNKLLGLKNCDKQPFVDELSPYLQEVSSSESELGVEETGRESNLPKQFGATTYESKGMPQELLEQHAQVTQELKKQQQGKLRPTKSNPTGGGNKRRKTKRKKTKRKKLKKKRSNKK